jgi:hypothetical protein
LDHSDDHHDHDGAGTPTARIGQLAWLHPTTPIGFGQIQIHVHVLYKGLEFPANAVIHEFAFSATCRKHKKAENPDPIPVSATKPFKINS